jgi:hypothetical protein
MDVDEFRRLADTRVRRPVTAETALGVWVQADEWLAVAQDRLGNPVLASWDHAKGQIA